VSTTIPFQIKVLSNPGFVEGRFDTTLVAAMLNPGPAASPAVVGA
jgi:biotin carboxylase